MNYEPIIHLGKHSLLQFYSNLLNHLSCLMAAIGSFQAKLMEKSLPTQVQEYLEIAGWHIRSPRNYIKVDKFNSFTKGTDINFSRLQYLRENQTSIVDNRT